jgi:hypothetical protein
MHYVDKPPQLTLFLTPKGVEIGREKGVAFGRDLTNRPILHTKSPHAESGSPLNSELTALKSSKAATITPSHSQVDNARRDACDPRDRSYAAMTRRPSFRCSKKPSLPLIQLRQYRPIALPELLERIFIDHPQCYDVARPRGIPPL